MVSLSLGIVLCTDVSDVKLIVSSLISAELVGFFRLCLLHSSGVESVVTHPLD